MTMLNTPSTRLEELARRREQFTCPDCNGEGWVQESDYEGQCCGGSDWECGARGCTGPIQVQVPIQVGCERCLGTGDTRAHASQGDAS